MSFYCKISVLQQLHHCSWKNFWIHVFDLRISNWTLVQDNENECLYMQTAKDWIYYYIIITNRVRIITNLTPIQLQTNSGLILCNCCFISILHAPKPVWRRWLTHTPGLQNPECIAHGCNNFGFHILFPLCGLATS